MRLVVLTLWVLCLLACGGGSAERRTPAPAVAAQRCPGPAPPRVAGPAPHMLVQDGHTATVNWMALNGDGRLLVTAAIDGSLRLWDTRSGMLLRRMLAYGAADGVALDRAGTLLAHAHARAGAKPHAVRVLRLATGQQLELPMGPRSLFVLAPDGKTIAVADQALTIYDTTGGNPLHDIPLRGNEASALGRDFEGHRLVVGTAEEVVVIDVKSGTPRWRVPLVGEDDFKRKIYAAGLLGDQLLVARSDATFELIDRQGTVRRLGRSQSIMHTQQGPWLGGRAGVQPVDRSNGTLGKPLAVGKDLFRTAMSADGRTLALAYVHPARGSEVRLMDVPSGRVMRTIEAQDTRVFAISVSPKGDQLAVGSQASVSLWSLPAGERAFSSPEGRLVFNRGLAYGPQGQQLVTYEGPMLKVRAPASGHLLRAWRPERLTSLAFRPGTSRLLTTHAYGSIMEWDLSEIPKTTAGDPDGYRALHPPAGRRLTKLTHWIDGAKLSPDGQRLLVVQPQGYDPAASQPKTPFAMLDAETFEALWAIDDQNLLTRHFAFSPDGQRLLLSTQLQQDREHRLPYRTVLRTYDAATGAMAGEVAIEALGPMAFRGERLLIGGSKPVILDGSTLAPRHELPLRDGLHVVVTPHPTLDGFFLGSYSGTTTLVSADGEVQAMLLETPGGDYVVASPDGAYRSSLDGAHRLAWAFADPLEAFSFEQFAARYDQPRLVAQRLAMGGGEALPPVARPPQVTVKGPRTRQTKGASFALELQVASGGRVDRVRIYVNGRLTNDELVCQPAADLQLEVPLQPGRNRVAILATDADGFASNPQTLDVESQARGPRPDLWVVALGVSQYPKLAAQYQLDFADDDARSMAAALQRLAGKGKAFARAHGVVLTDEQVTVPGAQQALAALAAMAPDDLAVVFLAGHGVRFGDGPMRFLTYGASLERAQAKQHGLGWKALEQALAAAPGRVLILLDACHSGHVTTEAVAPNEALAKALAAQNRTGLLVFAASRGSQLSYEVGGSGGGSRSLALAWNDTPPRQAAALAPNHGLFTSAMLEALSGTVPDRDESGGVELSEVIDYVRERVRQASNGQQTPWVARRELFGDFTLGSAP